MKFLPQRLAITSFGNGGFRFGSHSHAGDLLVLPSGMRAWNVSAPWAVEDFADLMREKAAIDFVLLGTGANMVRAPKAVVEFFQQERLAFDFMSTSSAVHTFNVMLAENRRVAAGLLAVQ